MDKDIKSILAQHIKNPANQVNSEETTDYIEGGSDWSNTEKYNITVQNPLLKINIVKNEEYGGHELNYIEQVFINRSIKVIPPYAEPVQLLDINSRISDHFSEDPQDIIDFEYLLKLCRERVNPQKQKLLNLLTPKTK